MTAPTPSQQLDNLRSVIAQALATSYRFVLAYPNSLDTVEQDASALICLIYENGFDLVPTGGLPVAADALVLAEVGG